jgi:NAD(P)-dependent dehydrogenase (short-subunit alcohol dehydrogenase family)
VTAADVAAALRAGGARALGVSLEVGSVDSIRAAFDLVRAEYGRLNVLINNAGTFNRKPSVDVTEADWDAVVDSYLKGLFFCSQEAGRTMLAQGGGKIVNVASQMAFVALPGRAAYCASKAGVVHLTRVLAQEWAPGNIDTVGRILQ